MDVLLEEGVAAAVVALDAGEDPDSFLVRNGAEAFRERLAAARPVLEAFMDSTLEAHGNSIEGKARAVDEILPRLHRLTSEIERELYLKRLGERTGVATEVLRRQGFKALPAKDKEAAPAAPRKSLPPPTAMPKEPGTGHKAQQWLLQLMLLDMSVRQKVAAEGAEKLFCTDTYRQLGERVVQLGAGEAPEVLLAAGLTEEQKTILSGILIKDEKVFADEPERVFLGCRQAVERERLKLRIEKLDTLIRQAEKEEDSQQRLIFSQEKLKLNRQLKGRDLSL